MEVGAPRPTLPPPCRMDPFADTLQRLREAFSSGRTRPAEFRAAPPTHTHTTHLHTQDTLRQPLTELQITPLGQWAGGPWTPGQSRSWAWAGGQLLRSP